MNIRYIIVLLAIVIFTLCAFGQGGVGTGTPTGTSSANTSDDRPASALSADTSASTQADADTSVNMSSGDMSADTTDDMFQEAAWLDDDDDNLDLDLEFAGDTAGTANEQLKLDVVRRNHAYSRQVKLAIWMMIFLAVALATAQSWNPN